MPDEPQAAVSQVPHMNTTPSNNQSSSRFPLWAFAALILIILGTTIGADTLSDLRRRLLPPSEPMEPELQASHVVITVDPDSVERVEVDYETAALAHIYNQGNPSVVYIQLVGSTGPFGGGPFAEGSGFVWDTEGHIVTNAHVATAVEGDILVTFSDETSSIAEIVGVDLDSDLAVIKIDPEGYDLHPVTMGNVDDLYVGMRVAAIGSPFSQIQTLTSGVVSALGRNIYGLRNFQIPDSIQFDAAINPGNSGGPLFNGNAQVVGVVTQMISPERVSSGIGMAVSASIVIRVVPALIADGSYTHSFLGIQGRTFSPICSDQLSLPKDARGAYVMEITSNSPAARSNLRGGHARVQNPQYGQICPPVLGGDLIVGVEEQEVRSWGELMVYLERYTSPGDEITLTVLRAGNYLELDVVLGARPTGSA